MRRVEKQARGGGHVILLHDGCNVAMGWDRSHSVAAADLILQQWNEQEGYEFVTIPDDRALRLLGAVMRIFVWHGYLLGGTGSNIYARQLAREWSGEGHQVTVFSQEAHPERFDLGGAETVRPDVGGFLPVFVIDEYDGYEVKRVQDSTRAELDMGRANAASMRERLPADFVFVNHVLRARRAGGGRSLRGQGARLGARVFDARERRALGLGAGGSLGRRGDHRRLRAHPRGRRGRVRPDGRVHEVRPASTSSSGSRRRERGARRSPRRVPEGSAESRERQRAAARRGQRRAPRSFPGRGASHRRLLREADREQGVQVLLEALRGLDARVVVVGFGDYRAGSSGRPRVSTPSSRARSSTVTSRTCSRSRTPPWRRRSSPRPSAWSRPRRPRPAARRSWRTSPGSRRSLGLERRYPAERHLPSFTNGDAGELRSNLQEQLGLEPEERDALRAAAREASVELWSWTSVARRILDAAG